jgi:L-alanine-DL-glutamate epimerase-like enolase superfamily enzyme
MLNWSIEVLTLPLKYNWKISRNETVVKRNLIVRVSDGRIQGMGEVAPNVRYHESPEVFLEVFGKIQAELSCIETLSDLHYLFDSKFIKGSLCFGIESAFVHLEAQKANRTVFQYLGLEAPGPVYTSYTLPILEPSQVKVFINEYNLLRFKSLKVKINNESGLEVIQELTNITDHPLRIDANEAWLDPDHLLGFMDKCKGANIEFFEQPMPASMVEEYKYLKTRSPYILIADESVTDSFETEHIAAQFHGINMKLMKAGGYLKGIEILEKAKKKGLKTMIGCMVETSLGIFSAINLCNDLNYIDLDGYFLVENEPFNMVSEREGRLFNVT